MATTTPLEMEQELFGLLADARMTNSLAVAGLVVVIVEHIANFRDEVELVWKARLSISSVFYIWIRYFTLFILSIDVSFMLQPQTSDRLCQLFFFGQMATSTIIIISADLILVLRVWILYGRTRRLLYFMVPLIAAEMIAMIVVGVFTISALESQFS
ncbi:hypothetical protein DFH06DRAFT_290830 [Mycena polygramma]|nr:hypothetical protein DFH06DRAFT_290830 [Mycena polygramma]